MANQRSRVKSARGTEPNVGIRLKFAKKLLTLFRSFERKVLVEVLMELGDGKLLAMDASLTNPAKGADPRLLEQLSRQIMADFKRNPQRAKQNVESFIQRNLARWTREVGDEGKTIAVWLARNLSADVTASQRRALQAAGLPSDFLKQRWTVPTGKGYISPTTARLLPALVEETTGLITRMTADNLARIQEVIVTGMSEGESFFDLKRTLGTLKGFDETRVKTVAIDQTNKISQGIQRGNDADLGIRQGVWVHVPGQYTSRQTHREFHGQVFDLDKGLFDEDVGKYVLPAECINCRCFYKPVIPKDIFK